MSSDNTAMDAEMQAINDRDVEQYATDHLSLAALRTHNACQTTECLLLKMLLHKLNRTKPHWQRFLLYEYLRLMQRKRPSLTVARFQWKCIVSKHGHTGTWYHNTVDSDQLFGPIASQHNDDNGNIPHTHIRIIEAWDETPVRGGPLHLGLYIQNEEGAVLLPLTDHAEDIVSEIGRILEAKKHAERWHTARHVGLYKTLLWLHVALSAEPSTTDVVQSLAGKMQTDLGSALFELHLVDNVLVSGSLEDILETQVEGFLRRTVETSAAQWTQLDG